MTRIGQQLSKVSTRTLASKLNISRFPVLNAYGQLLAEGYFESRVGAVTVVSSPPPDQVTTCEPSCAQPATISSGQPGRHSTVIGGWPNIISMLRSTGNNKLRAIWSTFDRHRGMVSLSGDCYFNIRATSDGF